MLEKPSATLFTFFLGLLFMAVTSFLPTTSTPQKRPHPSSKRKRKEQQKQQQKPPSSWEQIKGLLTCREIEGGQVHDPSKNVVGYSKLGSSCNSICSFRDVVHGNTRVIHREENSPESSSVGQETGLLRRNPVPSDSGRPIRSNGGYSSSSRGMHFRRLSGCYECHMIVDPSRYPLARTSICACSECGEVFTKAESLETHQAVRHAVSELGPEDSGRNIVEIIFKSSWQNKDAPVCNIERILKVHNTQRTIARFEDYRDFVKLGASTHNDRCAADGNELLRFHCTTLTCALGARGASTICGSLPACGVCTIIRHGFAGRAHDKGVRTTASSGRAHDCLHMAADDGRRAMLVCRVIAGRVRRVGCDVAVSEEDECMSAGTYDSVVGHSGIYSNLEDLVVFNPTAILPCFVVIYRVC